MAPLATVPKPSKAILIDMKHSSKFSVSLLYPEFSTSYYSSLDLNIIKANIYYRGNYDLSPNRNRSARKKKARKEKEYLTVEPHSSHRYWWYFPGEYSNSQQETSKPEASQLVKASFRRGEPALSRKEEIGQAR